MIGLGLICGFSSAMVEVTMKVRIRANIKFRENKIL